MGTIGSRRIDKRSIRPNSVVPVRYNHISLIAFNKRYIIWWYWKLIYSWCYNNNAILKSWNNLMRVISLIALSMFWKFEDGFEFATTFPKKENWASFLKTCFFLFYFSHETKTSSWLPPIECWNFDDHGLPYGWECAFDNDGKPYYIK